MTCFSSYSACDTLSHAMDIRPTLQPSQVVSYQRKSVARGESRCKSLGDQQTCNLRTAATYEVPLLASNCLDEEKNHGGDEWWYGRSNGLDEGDKRYRPMLTRLMHGICQDEIKCVIVWSLDRLWRSVAICEEMINIMAKHNCLLLDRNGPQDIFSPEGRQSIFQNAAAAQALREMAKVNSPRGVRESRSAGLVVVGSNVLGYRNIGEGRVEIRTEEILLVRRIYDMYVGGLQKATIARTLMSEGLRLAPDTYDKKSVKRCNETGHLIYIKQIDAILKDCRYQGFQPHEGKEWPCEAFLIDGEPAVSPALYQQAQDRMNREKRSSNHTSPKNFLAGLLRCGYCGQYLTINPVKQKDGSIKKYWTVKRHDIQSWCTHSLPNITDIQITCYVEKVLMPLLVCQLDEIDKLRRVHDVQDDIVILQKAIDSEAEAYRSKLRLLFDSLSAQALRVLDEDHKTAMEPLQKRLNALQLQAASEARNAANASGVRERVTKWADLTHAERRMLFHRVIRWVALIPSEDFSSRPKRRGGSRSTERKVGGAPPAGKLLILTAWGTFHTAVIKRVPDPSTTSWHMPLGLESATPAECLGSAADLPDPAQFAAGLERSYKGRGYKYHPSDVMPGVYEAKSPPEFDLS